MRRVIILLTVICFVITHSAAAAPVVSAQSAILLEYSTGRVLYAQNAEARLPMASTTKIMTALLALELGNETDIVTVSRNAAMQEGSSMYLKIGEEVSLANLLYGLLLTSGNDAAVAIAEHISGSTEAFATAMTARALELGAVNTQFRNPNGLHDEGHYTTALDLARITGKAMQNETFRTIVATPSAQIGDRYLSNHNKLLKLYDGAIGVKTGYTKAAGRTLASAAKRNGVELIAVTLNAPDDWNDHVAMFDYGFATMHLQQITKKGGIVGTVPIQAGTLECVPSAYASDFFLPVTDTDVIDIRIQMPDYLPAPATIGQPAGIAEIYLSNVKMGEVPLCLTTDVPATEKCRIASIFIFVFQRWVNAYR